MIFTVLLERRAERELLALPTQVVRRIDNRLRGLAKAPTPRGAIKLQGRETKGWRIRVGDYRILYTVVDIPLVLSLSKHAQINRPAHGSTGSPRAGLTSLR